MDARALRISQTQLDPAAADKVEAARKAADDADDVVGNSYARSCRIASRQ